MDSPSATVRPTEARHFKAYRPAWIGVTLLTIGILNCIAAIGTMLSEGTFNSYILTGIVVTAAGYLCLTRPYFAIAPNRLTVYNFIGSVTKRYPFSSFHDLYMEGNQLYIKDAYSNATAPAPPEKIKLTKWLTKASDWKTLKAIISDTAGTV